MQQRQKDTWSSNYDLVNAHIKMLSLTQCITVMTMSPNEVGLH